MARARVVVWTSVLPIVWVPCGWEVACTAYVAALGGVDADVIRLNLHAQAADQRACECCLEADTVGLMIQLLKVQSPIVALTAYLCV